MCSSLQFHYLHHRYFEVNYAGRGAAWLDAVCGTFCARFAEAEVATRTGTGDNKSWATAVVSRDDAKATLKGAPTSSFVGYMCGAVVCIGLWAYVAIATASGRSLPCVMTAVLLSILAGAGPAALAVMIAPRALANMTRADTAQDKSLQATRAWHLLGFGLSNARSSAVVAVGALVSVLPVCTTCFIALRP